MVRPTSFDSNDSMPENRPYNVIIAGCGRSGTSLFAGLLSKNNYFMGREPMEADDSNPKGYFEDREIERINEHILERSLPQRPRFIGRWLFRDRANRPSQRWISRLPLKHHPLSAEPEVLASIETLTKESPFCFKDPRFSYTLPVWKPYLNNTRFVCAFRNPAAVFTSMRKALNTYPYLSTLRFTDDQLWKVWVTMYQHILERHSKQGEWLFVNYDQLVSKEASRKIEAFLNVEVDDSFVNPKLNRSTRNVAVPENVQHLYHQLCGRAEYPVA